MPFGEITLSRRFGIDPRRVSVFGTRASWEVSKAGQLSTLVPLAEVARLGWPDFFGMEVTWRHPSGPAWGGIVTAPRRRPGAWELGCESWHVRMRKRRTTRLFRTLAASPGGLFLRLVNAVNYAGPLGFASITADEGGNAVRLDDRAMDLYAEAIPALLQHGPFEYDVTWDRHCRWRRQVGVDRLATVHLSEGRHIVEPWSLDGDLWTVANDLLGVPARRGYAESRAYTADHRESIRRYGRLQETLVVDRASKHMIVPILTRELAGRAEPLEALSLTVADVDGCFGWFGLGDTVRVTLGSAARVVAYRPLAIAIDEDAGLMSCSGRVVETIAGAVAA